MRDNLVASQENLLNTYRCLFDIDTHIVPNGCSSGSTTQIDIGAPPTASGFTAVSTGDRQTCGLRTDQTLACWGIADSGRYCLLTSSYGVECSGDIGEDYGPLSVPGGTFASISTGFSLACGLRTDQTIDCWTWRLGGTSDPIGLHGRFIDVSISNRHLCALRVDATAQCWADSIPEQCTVGPDNYEHCKGIDNTTKAVVPPPYTFTDILAAGDHFCVIEEFSHLTCTSQLFSCGIKTDQTIACWGDSSRDNIINNVPKGKFTAIEAAHNSVCGIKTDQSIFCWRPGTSDIAQMNRDFVPKDKVIDIAGASNNWCAIRTDNTIVCWNLFNGIDIAPQGTFTDISMSEINTCAVSTDATIVCWNAALTSRGTMSYMGHADFPSGQFKAISAGMTSKCAIGINAP